MDTRVPAPTVYAARTPQSEHELQAMVVQWCALARTQHPELAWVYAIPNAGKRSIGAYGYLRAEGLRPGIPDLCLPKPIGAYGAAYVEHKRRDHVPEPRQVSALRALAHMGNAVTVSYSFDNTREFLLRYVRGADVTTDHRDIPPGKRFDHVRALCADLDAIMRRRRDERIARCAVGEPAAA